MEICTKNLISMKSINDYRIDLMYSGHTISIIFPNPNSKRVHQEKWEQKIKKKNNNCLWRTK